MERVVNFASPGQAGRGFKPHPWPIFQRRYISRKWDWFWSPPPIILSLAWAGGGDPRDLIVNKLASSASFGGWVGELSGIGLDFDTAAQKITMPLSAVGQAVTDQLTLAILVVPRDHFTPGGIPARILDFAENVSGSGGTHLGWSDSQQRPEFGVTTGASRTDIAGSDESVVRDNVGFVCGTYDGANMRLYSNGELVAGPTAKSGNLDEVGTTYRIGNYFSAANRTFPGTILFCVAWDRVITAQQVALWNANRFDPFRMAPRRFAFAAAVAGVPPVEDAWSPAWRTPRRVVSMW